MSTVSNHLSRLQFEKVTMKYGSLLRLKGTIDESFDRKALFEGLTGIAVIDLDGVNQITSFGVREWVNALKSLVLDEVIFVKARPALVTQFNSVAHFGGSGQLVSFYAPYVCTSCDEPADTLIDLRTQFSQVQNMSPPEVRCPKCQTPTEFDDVPEVYFSYISQQSPPALSPLAMAMMDGTIEPATSNASKFKLDKEIVDTVTALWISGPLSKVGRLKRSLEGTEGEVVLVLQEIDLPSKQDAAQLALLVNSASTPMFLARIPPQLVFAWADTGLPANSRIVSIMAPFQCPTCQTKLPLESHVERLKTGIGKPCPNDGATMLTSLGVKERQTLASVLVKPPQSISNYLAGHLFPPRRDAATPLPAPRVSPTPPPPPPEALTANLTAQAPNNDTHFGRYELIRPLGRGGMAEVFLAKQKSLGGFSKTVVLKRILSQLGADEKFVEMFLQEARLAARISHANVVEIFDVGQVGSQYFIAMEYVRGTDLSRLLQTAARLNEPVPLELAARIVADVATGLYAAHTCVNEDGELTPIIHRDVSPHNVLISLDGQVKLTDFGIAKATDSAEKTPTHTIKGKLSYLAPEQVRAGMGPIDARADIFPLGLIFYQCVTLEQMFRRDTEYATLWALLNDPIRTLSEHRAVPPQADAILSKCLSRSPNHRYSSAKTVAVELEQLIASLKQPGTSARLASWIKHIHQLARERNVSTLGVDTDTGNHSRETQPNTKQTESEKPKV